MGQRFGAGAAAFLLICTSVYGQYDTCDGKVVDASTRRCPDGSIPIHHAESLQSGKGTSTLSASDCRGVSCSTAEGMQPGLTTLELEGRGFTEWAGYSLRLRVLRGAEVLEDRKVGVMANGKLTASISTYNYQPGVYAFRITPVRSDTPVLAAGAFRKESSSPHQDQRQKEVPITGDWEGINGTAGLIRISGDGTFTFNGTAGRYRRSGSDIYFSAPLAAWDSGHATIHDGVLEFYWTNTAGAKQWFTFAQVP